MTDYRVSRDVGTIKNGVLTLLVLNILCLACFGLWEYRLHQLKARIEATASRFLEGAEHGRDNARREIEYLKQDQKRLKQLHELNSEIDKLESDVRQMRREHGENSPEDAIRAAAGFEAPPVSR